MKCFTQALIQKALFIVKIQISANNSTPLRYSEKTRYLAITRVRISSRIRGH